MKEQTAELQNLEQEQDREQTAEPQNIEQEQTAELQNVAQANDGAKQNKGLTALWQFIKFGIVGFINTIVSYTVYSVCYYVFHTNIHVANVMGFVISVFNAFILQSKFVFKESEEGEHRIWWQVLIKTYISYAFSGLILTELLLILWINVLNIGQYLSPVTEWLAGFGMNWKPEDLAVSLAPFLNMVFTIPINFCVNKFWAYRQKK